MTHPWNRIPFRCGSYVSANEDPRHVARVDAIFHNSVLRVTWIDTGWRGDLHVTDDQVELAERIKQ